MVGAQSNQANRADGRSARAKQLRLASLTGPLGLFVSLVATALLLAWLASLRRTPGSHRRH
jgi:hypothetical protein